MALLIVDLDKYIGNAQAWRDTLAEQMPELKVRIWPDNEDLNEVEYLADFLTAKVIGKGPLDHAKCIAFWGSDVEVCKDFP